MRRPCGVWAISKGIGLALCFGVFQQAACWAADADSNLRTCLDGRYPALCNHSLLTKEQAARVAEAEHRADLKQCLDGRYPALCRHEMLSAEEAARVLAAEKRANLEQCLDGRYPVLCKHGLLTKDESVRVAEAERRANLTQCLDGRYPRLCNHGLLTKDEAARVAEAEKKSTRAPAVSTAPSGRGASRGTGSSGCESGHWIEDVMSDGEIIKLEDGSLWEVDAADTVDSALWLPVTDVVVCNNKMINIDDNETVGVRRSAELMLSPVTRSHNPRDAVPKQWPRVRIWRFIGRSCGR